MNDRRVKDVMTSLVVLVHPDDSIQHVARRLVRNSISGAPVVQDGKVLGVVSEVDISTALMGPANVDRGLEIADVLSLILRTVPTRHKHTRIAADVMSAPATTIGPDASLFDAARVLERHGIKRLPVVDADGYLLGILARRDLVRAMTRGDSDINKDVIEAIAVLGGENFEDLTVDVIDGVVTLSGIADRLTTRSIAVDIASRVPGVSEVVDRLEWGVDDTSMKPVPNHSGGDIPGPDPWAVGALVKGG
jgi:CBS domain-containing protein